MPIIVDKKVARKSTPILILFPITMLCIIVSRAPMYLASFLVLNGEMEARALFAYLNLTRLPMMNLFS